MRGGDGRATAAVQSFVPARYAPMIARAAQRWSVSAQLLAAQLYAESNFNPFAVSPAGAQGIAQFMPGTAPAYGLRDPFDAAAAIDAQAHLMHDLLARFALGPAGAGGLQRRPGRGGRLRLRAALRGDAAPTWRRSSACWAARARRRAGSGVRLVE